MGDAGKHVDHDAVALVLEALFGVWGWCSGLRVGDCGAAENAWGAKLDEGKRSVCGMERLKHRERGGDLRAMPVGLGRSRFAELLTWKFHLYQETRNGAFELVYELDIHFKVGQSAIRQVGSGQE